MRFLEALKPAPGLALQVSNFRRLENVTGNPHKYKKKFFSKTFRVLKAFDYKALRV
jgi:hypothetical protein